MDVFKESCITQWRLLRERQTAAVIYSKALGELTHKMGVVPKAEYEELLMAVESARARLLEAQANLETHINAHGCEGEAVHRRAVR